MKKIIVVLFVTVLFATCASSPRDEQCKEVLEVAPAFDRYPALVVARDHTTVEVDAETAKSVHSGQQWCSDRWSKQR